MFKQSYFIQNIKLKYLIFENLRKLTNCQRNDAILMIFSLILLQIKWKKNIVTGFNVNLHAKLYKNQCRIISGNFIPTFVRPLNEFKNCYTEKCDRLLKKGNPNCC